jgi:hypothetical protein
MPPNPHTRNDIPQKPSLCPGTKASRHPTCRHPITLIHPAQCNNDLLQTPAESPSTRATTADARDVEPSCTHTVPPPPSAPQPSIVSWLRGCKRSCIPCTRQGGPDARRVGLLRLVERLEVEGGRRAAAHVVAAHVVTAEVDGAALGGGGVDAEGVGVLRGVDSCAAGRGGRGASQQTARVR